MYVSFYAPSAFWQSSNQFSVKNQPRDTHEVIEKATENPFLYYGNIILEHKFVTHIKLP